MITLDGEDYETITGAASRLQVKRAAFRSWVHRRAIALRHEEDSPLALIRTADADRYTPGGRGRPRKQPGLNIVKPDQNATTPAQLVEPSDTANDTTSGQNGTTEHGLNEFKPVSPEGEG